MGERTERRARPHSQAGQVRFHVEGLTPDSGLLLRFSYDGPDEDTLYSFSYPTPVGFQTVWAKASRPSSAHSPQKRVLIKLSPPRGTPSRDPPPAEAQQTIEVLLSFLLAFSRASCPSPDQAALLCHLACTACPGIDDVWPKHAVSRVICCCMEACRALWSIASLGHPTNRSTCSPRRVTCLHEAYIQIVNSTGVGSLFVLQESLQHYCEWGRLSACPVHVVLSKEEAIVADSKVA